MLGAITLEMALRAEVSLRQTIHTKVAGANLRCAWRARRHSIFHVNTQVSIATELASSIIPRCRTASITLRTHLPHTHIAIMAGAPIITFKAGRCTFNQRKVSAVPTPGYIYMYSEDDLLHFCWRPRTAPSTEPELDLIMFPQDGTFRPLIREESDDDMWSPTNGRIFELSFVSSSQRHFFWMQAKSQAADGDPSWFSHRDQRLGSIIDSLLQGEEVDVQDEIDALIRREDGRDDDDEEGDGMDVDQEPASAQRGSGGAGQGAAGGNTSRQGGASGGRA